MGRLCTSHPRAVALWNGDRCWDVQTNFATLALFKHDTCSLVQYPRYLWGGVLSPCSTAGVWPGRKSARDCDRFWLGIRAVRAAISTPCGVVVSALWLAHFRRPLRAHC